MQDKGVYQHLWCWSVGVVVGPPHTSNPQHPIPPLARLSPRLIFHLSPVNWSGPTNSFGQLYKNSLTRKPIRNTIFCDALRSHVSEGSKGRWGGAYRPVFMHLCAPPVSGSGGEFAPTSSLLPPISALCVDEDLPFHNVKLNHCIRRVVLFITALPYTSNKNNQGIVILKESSLQENWSEIR